MDLSPWECGECGCHAIAFDCAACPQCGAPKAEPAPAADRKPAAKPKGGA